MVTSGFGKRRVSCGQGLPAGEMQMLDRFLKISMCYLGANGVKTKLDNSQVKMYLSISIPAYLSQGQGELELSQHH